MVYSDATHIDPKDFFDPNGNRPSRGLISKYLYILGFPGVGLLGAILHNYGYRRPIWSGIQRHAIGVTAGLAFGLWLDKRLQERAAGRDYFYYHYICEHPEDFPVIERKKFSDVFERWAPIR